ncbi:hypothetical protein QTO34_016036 [Cnephaeus nilssonii]|uniref:HECT-type E3 ubiquitin transferase n=1 Tax=Cnephaeus nilssonii TaxID=3371016 RepID=A0AA40LTE0_CNENI|nr:hypothetical protein QTO34_016036 [Eptesicus nilssonii]
MEEPAPYTDSTGAAAGGGNCRFGESPSQDQRLQAQRLRNPEIRGSLQTPQNRPHGHQSPELPEGYEQRTTVQGQVYFLHTQTGVSTWHDPRIPSHQCQLKEPSQPLPLPSEGSVEDEELPAQRYERDLVQKLKVLRHELSLQQPQAGHCRIEVSREEIFEESYRQIMKMRPKDLKKRLMVKFRGEEGLDYGGVAREWLYLLCHEMLNPYYGLFQYSTDNIYMLQINPDSSINPDHLSYFHFVGRIMGLAVFHGHYINGGFTVPFYKQLLGKPIQLSDLESVDPELHKSLVWILENDITPVLDHTFCVEHSAFGRILQHELKPNGRNVPVTEENKKEYVRSVAGRVLALLSRESPQSQEAVSLPPASPARQLCFYSAVTRLRPQFTVFYSYFMYLNTARHSSLTQMAPGFTVVLTSAQCGAGGSLLAEQLRRGPFKRVAEPHTPSLQPLSGFSSPCHCLRVPGTWPILHSAPGSLASGSCSRRSPPGSAEPAPQAGESALRSRQVVPGLGDQPVVAGALCLGHPVGLPLFLSNCVCFIWAWLLLCTGTNFNSFPVLGPWGPVMAPAVQLEMTTSDPSQLIIGGLDKIDLSDWKSNTRLKHCAADSNIVRWFWQAVETFDEERRARLLQFVTGSTRVPLQGFKALQGSTGAAGPRLFTIHLIDANTDNLPKAHTCFNRIDIPPYETYEKLYEKLLIAVEETCGFAVE